MRESLQASPLIPTDTLHRGRAQKLDTAQALKSDIWGLQRLVNSEFRAHNHLVEQPELQRMELADSGASLRNVYLLQKHLFLAAIQSQDTTAGRTAGRTCGSHSHGWPRRSAKYTEENEVS